MKNKVLKKLVQTIIDLGLAFILIEICVHDTSSYIAGLCTTLIWVLTDKLFWRYK